MWPESPLDLCVRMHLAGDWRDVSADVRTAGRGEVVFTSGQTPESSRALTGALGDDEAKVLAAVRGLQQGQADVAQLVAALVPFLPPETTPEQVAAAVADEQARRMAS